MHWYPVQRLLRGLFVIWLVATTTFFALRLIGDPVQQLLSGTGGSFQDVSMLREFFQLDVPLPQQYLKFLTNGIQGNLGDSFRYRQPALVLIVQRLPATFELAAAAMLIAVVIGFPVGVLTTLLPNSWIDRTAGMLTSIGQAMPTFWLSIMLVWLFAVGLGWLPATGRGGLNHLLLPAFSLSIFTLASVARLIRSSMQEVMARDYIRTARAKGLPESRVIVRHGLRNAILPVITIVGLHTASLLGGAIVIETIFDWPGIGSFLFSAIVNRDYPVVQAEAIIFAAVVVGINYLVDLLYTWVDPRIRRA